MSAVRRTRSSRELVITDLIDQATLQAIQDCFADEHSDVSTAILDKWANPVTFERNHCSYCKEIRESDAAYQHCRTCDQILIEKVNETGGPQWAICDHGGLLDFAAPLTIAGDAIAYFFLGQLRGRIGDLKTCSIRSSVKRLQELSSNADEQSQLCENVLAEHFRMIPVRKLSEIKRLAQAATELAEGLSAVLTKLHKWRRPGEVKEFVRQIVQCTDMDSLQHLCVARIPQLLGTDYCSIFTVESGATQASAQLVLRRTNYPPSRHLEGAAAYRKGQGLTGWVWKNRRPLRLANIKDKSSLRQYGELEWSQTVDDSENHREWLGVPLISRQGEVIGVVRVPEKTRPRHARGFLLEDQILLTTIARHVASQIEDIRTREITQRAMQACSASAVALARPPVRPDRVAKVILDACKSIWGTEGKAYFFNLLDDDQRTLRIRHVVGKLAGLRPCGREVVLDDSLSGVALKRGKPVTIFDSAKLRAKHERGLAERELGCALAAPIKFGDHTFGTLAVGGHRLLEFSREPDLLILDDLASLAGAALIRKAALEEAEHAFSLFASKTGHSLNSRILPLEGVLDTLEESASAAKWRKGTTLLRDAIESLKSAASLALRFGHAWRVIELKDWKVGEIVERLSRLYGDRRISWDVQGSLSIRCERELIEQVLVELVNNSRRFAPERHPRIEVRAFPKRESLRGRKKQSVVVLEVKDNGPGIPRDLKKRIFDPFANYGGDGLGLGLSFVKRVVEAHKGHIEECGREGSGACFRITLP